MSFECRYDSDWITLTPAAGTRSLRDLLTRRSPRNLDELRDADRDIAFAVADLQAIADGRPGELSLSSDCINMRHSLAARLDSDCAGPLGLPPLVDLALHTDAEGSLGSESFRLRYRWTKHGIRQHPQRVGAILLTADGDRRLPHWMMEAIEVADGLEAGSDQNRHWDALARFRQALGTAEDEPEVEAQASLTDFLKGLEVGVADRFSMSVKDSPDGLDFDVLPFSGKRLAERVDDTPVTDADAELTDAKLRRFQERLRRKGAMPAYRAGERSYLVIDRSALPALRVMAEKQHAPPAEREAFIRNPRTAITHAVEDDLRRSGQLDGLSSLGEEGAVESAAEPLFVETREYSERVVGKTVFEAPALDLPDAESSTWLPEGFSDPVVVALREMDAAEFTRVCDQASQAVASGTPSIEIAGQSVPATQDTLRTLQAIREKRERASDDGADTEPDEHNSPPQGPTILDTKSNFESLQWRPERPPRAVAPGYELGTAVRTPLKDHQTQGLHWQIAAWSAGLPGILNADEQGLGKTLQTIAFLRWLLGQMEASGESRGPLLVVAPTSLLRTWENEVQHHLDSRGLGSLIRLYGSELGSRRRAGTKGVDTESGKAKLDLDFLREANGDGKGHRFWLLTTYTTLTNYQHSLGGIQFSAAVFDEIQALKNPASLRSFAARAIDADFRIGLTGTPIENRSTDIWAIMDQLCPSALGTLQDFNTKFGKPEEQRMRELHDLLFKPRSEVPPIAIRRTKDDAAKDLPEKTRLLHPARCHRDRQRFTRAQSSRWRKAQRGEQLSGHCTTFAGFPCIQTCPLGTTTLGSSAPPHG